MIRSLGLVEEGNGNQQNIQSTQAKLKRISPSPQLMLVNSAKPTEKEERVINENRNHNKISKDELILSVV